MKVLLSWLRDFVDIDVDINVLVEKLVSCGFEVEEVIYERDNIKNVVSSRILSIEKHKDADKLNICKADIGNNKVLQIITAAENVFVGAIVPLALDGAELPNGVKIKKGKLRGEVSEGMFCGGEELALTEADYKGAEFNGLLILDKDTEIGIDINDVLDKNDVILDIAVTSNRPDCNSILGISREIAAVLNKRIKFPDISYKQNSKKENFEIIRENKELCSRYIGCIVENIKQETPYIIKKRLRSLGHKSRSAFVDITNYIRIEIGQPMHAFDLLKIKDSKIIIRNAKENEKIKTLDDIDATLYTDNLVIADAENALAIAGIMGGLNSAVSNETKNILFESASFKKENIRKSSRNLNIRSESSFRYERGIDNYSQELGMKRALHLVDKYNLGDITSTYIDSFDGYDKEKEIKININHINKILGIDVDINRASQILNSLEINNTIKNNDLYIKSPIFRDDINTANDVAEEIIRFLGYENITETLLKDASQTGGGRNDKQKRTALIKEKLVQNGFFETLTYSFTSYNMLKDLNLENNEKYNKYIQLGNPLGRDLSIMRTTLAYSLLNVVEYNFKRGNKDLNLFEISKVYYPTEKELPRERYNLVLVSTEEENDFYKLKALAYNLISTYNSDIKIDRSNLEFLHPGKSIDIYVLNIKVGYLGEVHPEIQKSLEIPKTNILEIDLDLLEELYKDEYKFNEISKFPSVQRDIALTFDEEILAKDIISLIKKVGGNILKEAKIFDIFRSEKIGKNKKSVAISLEYSSLDRTLEDQEIENRTNKILKNLEKELNGQLR